MLYEVMNQLKEKGSVNTNDLVDILEKFEDINTKESVNELNDQTYLQYAKFGLEAMQDTLKNHKD